MRKAKGFIFFSLVLLSISSVSQFVLAQERIEDKFFQANKFYSQGEYTKAVSIYEEIIGSGLQAGNVYYNLSNAYFKLGRKGKAILNYERALKLIPKDEDLSANLKFVRSTLEETRPGDNLKWFEKVYISFRDTLSVNSWISVLFTAYLLLFFVIILAIFSIGFRKTAKGIVFSLLILTFSCAVFTAGKIRALKLNREGVIIDEEVDVRYSPSFSGAVAFKLHEGIKVFPIRCEGDWCQIRLSRDKSGWVEKETVEEIR